jgi:hypothetical protein
MMDRSSSGRFHLRLGCAVVPALALLLVPAQAIARPPQPPVARSAPGRIRPAAMAGLDCNGFSPIQRAVKLTMLCADPKGPEGESLEDNGHYVGHDEPAVRFVSTRPGSGAEVLWHERLPLDPARDPTVASPGHDVTHFFELSVAPWFGMALCDPQSYPQTPCTPRSDRNAPRGRFPGGGAAFTCSSPGSPGLQAGEE